MNESIYAIALKAVGGLALFITSYFGYWNLIGWLISHI